MVSKELNDWLQVVGLFGVLGGLIFVGLQLRQERQIALIQAVESATESRNAWAETLGSNSDVWVRGLADQDLTDAELAQFNAMAAAHELSYFNNWNRNRTIGSTDSATRWVREAALDFHTYPGLMNWWNRHVERLQITDPGTSDGWVTAVDAEIARFKDSL